MKLKVIKEDLGKDAKYDCDCCNRVMRICYNLTGGFHNYPAEASISMCSRCWTTLKPKIKMLLLDEETFMGTKAE